MKIKKILAWITLTTILLTPLKSTFANLEIKELWNWTINNLYDWSSKETTDFKTTDFKKVCKPNEIPNYNFWELIVLNQNIQDFKINWEFWDFEEISWTDGTEPIYTQDLTSEILKKSIWFKQDYISNTEIFSITEYLDEEQMSRTHFSVGWYYFGPHPIYEDEMWSYIYKLDTETKTLTNTWFLSLQVNNDIEIINHKLTNIINFQPDLFQLGDNNKLIISFDFNKKLGSRTWDFLKNKENLLKVFQPNDRLNYDNVINFKTKELYLSFNWYVLKFENWKELFEFFQKHKEHIKWKKITIFEIESLKLNKWTKLITINMKELKKLIKEKWITEKEILFNILLFTNTNNVINVSFPECWKNTEKAKIHISQNFVNWYPLFIDYWISSLEEKNKIEFKELLNSVDFETDNSLTKFVNNKISFNKLDYVPQNLEKIWTWFINVSKWKQFLRREALVALEKMAKDFYNEFGEKIEVISAYRSYKKQKWIKDRWCSDKFCAKAWFSEHQSWLAVDFWETTTKDDFFSNNKLRKYYDWLDKNAHNYGFHNTYQKWSKIDWYAIEPWHWRYVWIPLATYLKENDITIAEFYYKFKNKLAKK